VSDVILDPDKLRWLSGEYTRRLSPEELADRLESHLGRGTISDDPAERRRIAGALQERIDVLSDARELLAQFNPPDPMRWDPSAVEALQGEETVAILNAVHERLAGLEDWDGELAMQAVREAGRGVGARGRELFMPVRAAVTGATAGPELDDIFAVQGRETTLRALKQSAEMLGSGQAN
jgi:nondiscriminating glutamyl-tRNA synthetase